LGAGFGGGRDGTRSIQCVRFLAEIARQTVTDVPRQAS